jgi:hypothetical protein
MSGASIWLEARTVPGGMICQAMSAASAKRETVFLSIVAFLGLLNGLLFARKAGSMAGYRKYGGLRTSVAGHTLL